MKIAPEEIRFIIDGIMKAQAPRDEQRRIEKAEKSRLDEERKQALLKIQRSHSPHHS